MSISSTSTDIDASQGEKVVNVDHLMTYVNEMLTGGAELCGEDNFPVALQVYQQGLDAIAQCEELPMHVDDVPKVVQGKSNLLLGKAKVYRKQELYRRCLSECKESFKADPNNAEALLLRARCYQHIKEYHHVLDDLRIALGPEMLRRSRDVYTNWFSQNEDLLKGYDEKTATEFQIPPPTKVTSKHGENAEASTATTATGESPVAGGENAESPVAEGESTTVNGETSEEDVNDESKVGLDWIENPNQVKISRNRIKYWYMTMLKKKEEHDDTFEERLEDAAADGIKDLRERFEEVVRKTGLKQRESLAEEVADMIQREGWSYTHVTSKAITKLANVYQIDEDDAEVILTWIQKATIIHNALNE